MSSPHYTADILDLGIPVLGICYGCQLIAWMAKGEVKTAPVSEYGKIDFNVLNKESKLFKNVPETSIVWMSHTDYISAAPQGFAVIGNTNDCPCAAMENVEKIFTPFSSTPRLLTHSSATKCFIISFMKFVIARAIGLWTTLSTTLLPHLRKNRRQKCHSRPFRRC